MPNSEQAKNLLLAGFPVLPVPFGTKSIIIRNWQKYTDPARTLRLFDKIFPESNEFNVGIICGQVLGIDIDILDKSIVDEISKLIFGYFGPLPQRTGRAPKTLFVVKTDSIITKKEAKSTIGKVEILATGQQFIGFGQHPDGFEYVWNQPLPRTIRNLVTVTEEELDSLLAEIKAIYKTNGINVKDTTRKTDTPVNTPNLDKAEALSLLSKIDASDYDVWLRVGMALKHELGDEGFKHWVEWSSTAKNFSEKACTKRWKGFKGDITFRTIAYYAKTNLEELPLLRTQKNDIKVTFYNAKVLLEYLYGPEAFRYNVMKERSEVYNEAVSTVLLLKLREKLAKTFRIEFSQQNIADAVYSLADGLRFDPARDYLLSLKWDNNKRIETWLKDYAGVEDSAYSRQVAKKFLIAAVARVLKPGCKVDTVLILEGRQGIYKSTLLRNLVPESEWFSDSIPSNLHDKDAILYARNAWIIEIQEFERIIRKDESDITKTFFSISQDTIRRPYQALPEELPRRCIFAGSTNKGKYLRDATGNRRYWPVVANECKPLEIAKVRDQLWAEAVYEYTNGAIWWIEANDPVFLEQQSERLEVDPYEDILRDFFDECSDKKLTTQDIWEFCFQGEARTLTYQVKNRLAACMKNLGYENKVIRVDKKKTARVWLLCDN